MGWYYEMVEKFRKLPVSLMGMHIVAKFVFAIGLGMLLARYTHEMGGWLLIIASFVIAIPSTYRMFRKT